MFIFQTISQPRTLSADIPAAWRGLFTKYIDDIFSVKFPSIVLFLLFLYTRTKCFLLFLNISCHFRYIQVFKIWSNIMKKYIATKLYQKINIDSLQYVCTRCAPQYKPNMATYWVPSLPDIKNCFSTSLAFYFDICQFCLICIMWGLVKYVIFELKIT